MSDPEFGPVPRHPARRAPSPVPPVDKFRTRSGWRVRLSREMALLRDYIARLPVGGDRARVELELQSVKHEYNMRMRQARRARARKYL